MHTLVHSVHLMMFCKSLRLSSVSPTFCSWLNDFYNLSSSLLSLSSAWWSLLLSLCNEVFQLKLLYSLAPRVIWFFLRTSVFSWYFQFAHTLFSWFCLVVYLCSLLFSSLNILKRVLKFSAWKFGDMHFFIVSSGVCFVPLTEPYVFLSFIFTLVCGKNHCLSQSLWVALWRGRPSSPVQLVVQGPLKTFLGRCLLWPYVCVL